jgi:small membrane protein
VIKFLLVPAVILAVVLSLRSRHSLRGQARRKIFAGLTVIAGVVAVVSPGIPQRLADLVGVDRGTDLLLYVLAVVIIYSVGSNSARFREQETGLVRLAREVALAECETRLIAGAQHFPPRPGPHAQSDPVVHSGPVTPPADGSSQEVVSGR